jgi:hypothetical protein
MADFSSVTSIRDAILGANQIVNTFQVIYAQCLAVQSILARYQSDPAFKAEADHLFTPAQIAELGQMIAQVNALQSDWATNHKGPLNLS